MGQIVKRKKKGRPPKADLAKRGSSPPASSEPELRRSHRRRNVRYNIDYDDYIDEDFEEEDEEEERRRERKLKLVLKLNQGQEAEPPSPPPPMPPSRGRGVSSASARGRHAEKEEVEEREEEEDDEEEEEEEEESERRKKKIKKRRINGGDEVDHDDDEEVDDDNEDDDRGDGDAEVCTKSFLLIYQERGRKLKQAKTLKHEKKRKIKIKIVLHLFDAIVWREMREFGEENNGRRSTVKRKNY